ncbi:MAG: TonB-dependent receptor [Saprospiraceae bacterium]|nr:TonB-dependent receptor [Saprospiraceae bacterium]
MARPHRSYPLLIIPVLLALLQPMVLGQSLADEQLDFNSPAMSLQEFVEALKKQIPGKIYCVPTELSKGIAAIDVHAVALSTLLNQALDPLGLIALFHRNNLIIVLPRDELSDTQTPEYFQALEESMIALSQDASERTIVGSLDGVSSRGDHIVEGRILDAEIGEEIIGATISIAQSDVGSTTDADGSYKISLKSGEQLMIVQYVGYQILRVPLNVLSSGKLDLGLDRSTVLLDEVVVQARAKDNNIKETQVGVTRVSTKDLVKLPSFLGEVDVVKGLLLQPGITSIGEGSNGFNVRGGNVDQNLIMIDEGMIFNANHALGFFSSFNSDVVREAVLYKGTMPATYGGRLASVLDVKVRDGSFDRWHVKGGVGLVSSRINVDGPIKKQKTSLLLAGRSTYSNWLLRQVQIPEVQSSSVNFYDLNMRLAHRFNEKNNLMISAFVTQDKFAFNDEFGFDYRTMMGQLQFRSVLGLRVLSTTNVIRSNFDSNQEDLRALKASTYETGVDYWKGKHNFSYLGEGLEANVGLSGVFYDVKGNHIMPTSLLSTIQPEHLSNQKGIEWGIYADVNLEVSPRLSLVGGLRYAIFQFLGPHDTYAYEDPNQPVEEELLTPLRIVDRVVKTYADPQPRLSFRYNLSATSSIKGGYGRTVQYINQIFNSETPTPTSFWQLSNQYIAPQKAHNFSLGYFHNFNENIWITSIEGFYRDIDQLLDYRGFADLLVNDHLETELLRGEGRAYGVELSVNRQVGKINGWFNYTYSRSERQVPGINDGEWYPSNFDKPHDFKLVSTLQINRRNSLSLNFSFGTGRPITVPLNRYVVQDRVVVLEYSQRNAFRIPDYHRLDVSYSIAQGFKKNRKFKTNWTFSIYNIYSRKNPYSVFVEQDSSGNSKIKRLAVLGTAFPALTFNFELL